MRTVAQIQEEYTAARTAYLNAVNLQSFSESGGTGSISGQRADINTLRDHMLALEREMTTRQRGSIRRRGFAPQP